MPERGPERSGRTPAVVAAATMALVAAPLATSAPGIGDSAELTLAIALAAIPHPTGYPLYVVGGHVFSTALHALGASWALATAYWSVAGAAVAMFALTRLVQHVLALAERRHDRPDRPGTATAIAALVVPLALFALHPVWLETAAITEVYTWSVAGILAIAASTFGRMRVLDFGAGSPATDLRAAALWGVLAGACGAHHVTSVFFVVPLGIALWWAHLRSGRARFALLTATLAGALVPLASYAWIAWRAMHPAAFQWPVEPTLGSWWMHVRGAAYTHLFGQFALSPSEWTLIRNTMLPGLVAGLAAGGVLVWRTGPGALRTGGAALLSGAALQIAFVAAYGVPDSARYLLPPLAVACVVPGVLLRLTSRWPRALVLAIGLGVPVAAAAAAMPRAIAARNERIALDAEFRGTWARIPFDEGIVLWADDHVHRFILLQQLEGLRPRIYVDNPDMLLWPARRRAFERRFGVDPLEDLEFRSAADIGRIGQNVQRLADVPVIVLAP
jgi:hypothetical protein